MARPKVEVDKRELQKVINELESKQEFANPSFLWKAVEETEWAKEMKPHALKASTVYLRVKEYGIVYKTKPGKRGRSGGIRVPGQEIKRVPRKEKMKKYDKNYNKMILELPMFCRQRYAPVVERARAGSLKAAIKLKCLDCSNYQPVEIKLCTIPSCPLYAHRPFKQTNETGSADVSTTLDEDTQEEN